MAGRCDEWIIEKSRVTVRGRLLQIFVQLLAVPSLIAQRPTGGLLGAVLFVTLPALPFVVVFLLNGGIANVNRLVVSRERVRLRAEAQKWFPGYVKIEIRDYIDSIATIDDSG